MVRASRSYITPKASDVPIIIGMIARHDRHHDIAAWFGLNQGRIADTQKGKYGPPKTSPSVSLPPKGPPGIKGRHLRQGADAVLGKLNSGDVTGALAALKKAIGDYDADEL
jgi:hypothetical protein